MEVDGIRPLEGDYILPDKRGLCGFHGTSLNKHLEANGIKNVVLAGFLTSCCVDSTMRGVRSRCPDADQRTKRCVRRRRPASRSAARKHSCRVGAPARAQGGACRLALSFIAPRVEQRAHAAHLLACAHTAASIHRHTATTTTKSYVCMYVCMYACVHARKHV